MRGVNSPGDGAAILSNLCMLELVDDFRPSRDGDLITKDNRYRRSGAITFHPQAGRQPRRPIRSSTSSAMHGYIYVEMPFPTVRWRPIPGGDIKLPAARLSQGQHMAWRNDFAWGNTQFRIRPEPGPLGGIVYSAAGPTGPLAACVPSGSFGRGARRCGRRFGEATCSRLYAGIR